MVTCVFTKYRALSKYTSPEHDDKHFGVMVSVYFGPICGSVGVPHTAHERVEGKQMVFVAGASEQFVL